VWWRGIDSVLSFLLVLNLVVKDGILWGQNWLFDVVGRFAQVDGATAHGVGHFSTMGSKCNGVEAAVTLDRASLEWRNMYGFLYVAFRVRDPVKGYLYRVGWLAAGLDLELEEKHKHVPRQRDI
jgi:hypothetical protein